jgi:hypothetical protein
MNTGLQDAANLAWKLALVHAGAADDDLLDSYEAERRPAAATVAASGDDFEHAQMLTNPTERGARDESMRSMLADPAARHHEIVAEVELNIDYAGSPIVAGDANGRLGPGQRLPDTIPVRAAGMAPGRLHELARRAGHTLLLLRGPAADRANAPALFQQLHELARASPRFDAALELVTDADVPDTVGHLDPSVATLLGVDGTTIIAVRPDGYIGLRADRDHIRRFEDYDALIRSGENRGTRT